MAAKDSANIIYEIQRSLTELGQKLSALAEAIKYDDKVKRLNDINERMAEADFWEQVDAAQALQKEKSNLQREVESFKKALDALKDCGELFDLVKNDSEALLELEADVKALELLVGNLALLHMLSGEHDRANAILSVNVGAGGVDSQDFTEMLLRMYKHYAERRGFQIEVMDIQPAEEAGIKSATILISGPYAYGFLKAEIGVHRLVRISPFDSGARRHTSFASVWVIPEIEDDIDVAINSEDLRIDTFRAGGAGGQHVNKTDSAVRITHIPTNTVVACQSERSQIKNRSTAMKLLKARLYELEMRKRLAEKDKAEAQKLEASFGSQIRNYVLAPYRLVKDLRTGYEVGNVDAVLDGDIQAFIESYLLQESAERK
jgi:peptide chain release factor 2